MTEHGDGRAAELVATAERLARELHGGQTDRAGEPYAEHPARVAARVTAHGPDAVAAGWLHDVLEDCPVTREQLASAGMPARVLDAVEALTKRPGEPPEAYFARVRGNALARAVKAADLDDNTDPDRLARLDPATRDRLTAKYVRSRALLAGEG